MTSSAPTTADAAGTWTLGDLPVSRVGFGAMRLTGSTAFHLGVPSDRARAIAVLREAVALGVNHIDTAAFCFSALRSADELINSAFGPCPAGLVIATEAGPYRDRHGAVPGEVAHVTGPGDGGHMRAPVQRPGDAGLRRARAVRPRDREHPLVVRPRGAALPVGSGRAAEGDERAAPLTADPQQLVAGGVGPVERVPVLDAHHGRDLHCRGEAAGFDGGDAEVPDRTRLPQVGKGAEALGDRVPPHPAQGLLGVAAQLVRPGRGAPCARRRAAADRRGTRAADRRGRGPRDGRLTDQAWTCRPGSGGDAACGHGRECLS
ncbi:hypothetical protein ACIQGO_40780 [Streptomyces shenzhenensis]|uniref:hypothetical protein n=1 Tax=Streptomyces shenzhenensis TaxID=943815 RepID=UPI0038082B9A